jgi:hypothetical protein
MKPIVIGLTGQAHSGKDTTADYLVSQLSRDHRVIKIALADQLKVICQKLIQLFYGQLIPLEQFYDLQSKEQIRDNLPLFTGQPFKIRTVLQQIGTEIFRDLVTKCVWCDYIKDNYITQPYDIIIISDIRMSDEIDYFNDLVKNGLISQFKTYRILRNIKSDKSQELSLCNQQHRSEIAITQLHVTDEINNNSSIEDLHNLINQQIIESIDYIV